MNNNKLVVYTALFGDYDDLLEPNEKFEGCDFICFTDQNHLKSDIWDIKLIKEYNISPNLMNRKYKILPHLFLSEYKQSLYIDANIKILKNPIESANRYLHNFDFVQPKHFKRDCLFKEAKECIILGKSKYRETLKQINFYKKKGFPTNFGLGENNIIFRNHHQKFVIKIMNDWWKQINTYTNRDQLSLAYVLWKNNEVFYFMDESSRDTKGFYQYTTHKNFNNRTLIKRVYDSVRIRCMRIIIDKLSNCRIIKL